MTAAITGLKISHPLSNELTVGFSQKVPANSPVEPGAVRDVAAGAEGPAGAGHDGHPGLLVVAEPGEGVVEVPAHLPVDGVERFGPVVGDGGHVAVELVGGEAAHRTSMPQPIARRAGRS